MIHLLEHNVSVLFPPLMVSISHHYFTYCWKMPASGSTNAMFLRRNESVWQEKCWGGCKKTTNNNPWATLSKLCIVIFQLWISFLDGQINSFIVYPSCNVISANEQRGHPKWHLILRFIYDVTLASEWMWLTSIVHPFKKIYFGHLFMQ